MKIRHYRSLFIIAIAIAALINCPPSPLPVTGLGGASTAIAAGPMFTDLTAKEARAFIASEDPFILDVRTPGEFQQGHLPDAVLIPVQELAQRVGEIAKYRDQKVFIYCRSGNRSVVASNILIQAGFTDLYSLRYDIREWVQAGYPVVVPGSSS